MDNKTPKRLPTQVVLTIRAIVGGYVLYLAYGIMTSGDEKGIGMYVAVALMAIAGAVLLVWALKMLVLGQYEGGKRDNWSMLSENQEEEASEEAVSTEKTETIIEVEPSEIEELD